MPGDNVEMICSLQTDVAAEIGSRYVSNLLLGWVWVHITLAGSRFVRVTKRVSYAPLPSRTQSDLDVFSWYRHYHQDFGICLRDEYMKLIICWYHLTYVVAHYPFISISSQHGP